MWRAGVSTGVFVRNSNGVFTQIMHMSFQLSAFSFQKFMHDEWAARFALFCIILDIIDLKHEILHTRRLALVDVVGGDQARLES